MSKWQHRPFRIEVKAGDKKVFCRCGHTKKPPYCDGSHSGTQYRPCVEQYERDKIVSICACGLSGNLPYCDGSHKVLPE